MQRPKELDQQLKAAQQSAATQNPAATQQTQAFQQPQASQQPQSQQTQACEQPQSQQPQASQQPQFQQQQQQQQQPQVQQPQQQQHQVQQPQQQAMQSQPQQPQQAKIPDFETGICDNLSCYALCCSCLVMGENHHIINKKSMGSDPLWCILSYFVPYVNIIDRMQLRAAGGYEDNLIMDILFGLCLPCCSIGQVNREAKIRMLGMVNQGGVWIQPGQMVGGQVQYAPAAGPIYAPQGVQYGPQPQGVQYAPQGMPMQQAPMQYAPQGIQYAPQGVQYAPQGVRYVPQGVQMQQAPQLMPAYAPVPTPSHVAPVGGPPSKIEP